MSQIGRFDPPKNGAQMIDPMMRKSTEFPIWLDKPETKEMLRGKQVLMYCTGGVRYVLDLCHVQMM
jgi:predicted sulfurtransferase